MNIHELDLNLLLVFNAIYVEKSISGAAKKLGMTQPAVSNALRRLRTFTGDTLFYKSGKGVAPTRAAMTLAIPVGHALDSVERGLSSVRNFDPATSVRHFRIGVSDIIHDVLVPTLVMVTRQQAPGITLEFTLQAKSEKILEALTRGEYDLALTIGAAASNEHVSTKIWDEPFKIIVGRNNPLAKVNRLTVDMLRDMPFVVSTHVPRLRAFLDEIFKGHGVPRKVACLVADTHNLYTTVAVSDLAACVGANYAEPYAGDGALVMFNLPFDMPSIVGHLTWARQADDDLGHKWIRDRVIEILHSAVKLYPSDN